VRRFSPWPDGRATNLSHAENRKSAIETVTPLQEADGSWKVSGYFIK
jgi:hypothetical protein